MLRAVQFCARESHFRDLVILTLLQLSRAPRSLASGCQMYGFCLIVVVLKGAAGPGGAVGV
eukprot:COSAG06_NODE_2908_length_6105_cov_9.949384_4_plen_61_part_00